MNNQSYSIGSCCHYFKKSRQGFYFRIHDQERKDTKRAAVISQVVELRKHMPKIGGRKLHYKINSDNLRIGRDALFRILREEGLLIRRKRRYITTTDSRHNLPVYENLIKDLEITHAEEVMVSDITYIKTEEGDCYLSIVGDAYSKKILGKNMSTNLKARSSLSALISAFKKKRYNRRSIHHSDRGSQYCSKLYTDALKLTNCRISMSDKGKAYENPVAERMIGILKDEYGLDQVFKTIVDADKTVDQSINSYNTERPHLSCGYLTPQQAHEQGEALKNMWRKKSYSHINKRKKEAKKEKLLLLKV